MMIRTLPVVVAVAACAACAPPAPGVTAHSAVLPLSGPCPADASAGVEFTTEAQSLRLTVNADDLKQPVSAEGDGASLTIEEVPAGENRVVALFGMVGTVPVWRGVKRGVSVVQGGEPTEVDVLMARVADLTCARGADNDARAFHTATVLDDGRILLVGGARTSADASGTCGAGCRRLTATGSASIYNPADGTFQEVAPLQTARLFHSAAKLDDGRVVIVGGTSETQVRAPDTQYPFPIVPTQPVSAVEVFDPSSLSFTSGGSDPGGARIFAAAASRGADVIVTGGIPAAGSPRNDLSNALDTTSICGGRPLSCSAGPAMNSKRAGHIAFRIEPDGVFLWGGSVQSEPVGGVPGYQLELLRDGGAFELLNVAAMSATRNLFFAASAQYVGFRVLIAGGLQRSPDGTFAVAQVDVGGNSSSPVYVYDATYDVAGGIAVGPQDGPQMQLTEARFFGSAAPLSGETRVLIAGGFKDLAFAPSGALELYDQGNLTTSPIAVGGTPRTLRQPRGGLVAITNGDGAVLLSGGETPDASGRVPLATAEIFADPQLPTGVAQ